MMTSSTTSAGEMIPLKRAALGSAMRKKLSDITNTQQSLTSVSISKDENPKPIPSTAKEYIEQLCKENTSLLRLVAEKNKRIEYSSLELQKLQLNMQKMHQQNCQLAQAHSHMLAELNNYKDRLKAAQHELGCINAVLLARSSEQEKAKIPDQKISTKEKPATEEDPSKTFEDAADNKLSNPNRRRRQSRVSSSCKSAATQQTSAKQNGDNNKRICLRRRSSTCKSEKPERTDDLFEIEDAKFPVHPLPSNTVADSCPVLVELLSDRVSNAEVKVEKEDEEGKRAPRDQVQELRRSLTGRPSRRAAEKVSTYKEKPVNVKMRRSE